MTFSIKDLPCEKTIYWSADYRIQAKLYPIDNCTKCALHYRFIGRTGEKKKEAAIAFEMIFTHLIFDIARNDYDNATPKGTHDNFVQQLDKVCFQQYTTGDRHLLCMN